MCKYRPNQKHEMKLGDKWMALDEGKVRSHCVEHLVVGLTGRVISNPIVYCNMADIHSNNVSDNHDCMMSAPWDVGNRLITVRYGEEVFSKVFTKADSSWVCCGCGNVADGSIIDPMRGVPLHICSRSHVHTKCNGCANINDDERDDYLHDGDDDDGYETLSDASGDHVCINVQGRREGGDGKDSVKIRFQVPDHLDGGRRSALRIRARPRDEYPYATSSIYGNRDGNMNLDDEKRVFMQTVEKLYDALNAPVNKSILDSMRLMMTTMCNRFDM
ncbi:hypothetical protein F5B18DRAFT_519262 [Nemania serpens]|nr:hypothetical protein F5B18DRAFT_519262 [Nemania serpens]